MVAASGRPSLGSRFYQNIVKKQPGTICWYSFYNAEAPGDMFFTIFRRVLLIDRLLPFYYVFCNFPGTTGNPSKLVCWHFLDCSMDREPSSTLRDNRTLRIAHLRRGCICRIISVITHYAPPRTEIKKCNLLALATMDLRIRETWTTKSGN